MSAKSGPSPSPTTSTVLPAACPVCGFIFGLTDVATQEAHYLAHMAVILNSSVTLATTPRDSSDW